MATKAIYTKVDGKYYRVNQSTDNPNRVVRMPRTHSQMNTEDAAKVVKSTIWINTLDGKEVFSNKELYDEMIAYFNDQDIVDIDIIENNFLMCCDYSVFDENGKEINRNIFTRHLKPSDAIYNLGVNSVSELVYKQVKIFNEEVALNVKNEYPMGIMRNSSKIRYRLVINDISVYQDLIHSESDVHNSWDKNSFPLSSALENMVKVYSTYDNGIAIAAVEIPFIPRKIVLEFNLTLDDLIVVYDNQKIVDAVHTNVGDIITGGGGGDSDEDNGPVLILNGGSSK